MTLQLLEGFENSVLPPSFGHTANAFTWAAGRAGGISARPAGNQYNNPCTAWFNLPNPLAAFSVGFALAISPWAASTTAIQLKEGATVHLAVSKNAGGYLQLVNGTGAVLGTATVLIDTGVWNHFELTVAIHDTTGAARLGINGQTIIDVTNVDTRNGGTTGVVGQVLLSTPNGYYQAINHDDWYLTDTTGPAPFNGPLGDCKVQALRPTADGASSGWVGSDADSLNNWQHVDDVSTTTDYVGSNVVGARDLYALADPTGTGLGDVLAVQVQLLAAKSDAGNAPGNLNVVTRSVGGTVSTATAATPAQLATSYQWFRGPIMATDPNGDPWSVARLVGLQAGVEILAP